MNEARDRGRLTRRAALAGSMAGLFAAACARRTPGARQIEGGFVDNGITAGHALRDGSLSVHATPRERRARVVIVGGGIAGLAAAWRLQRAGVDGVELLELAPKVGGTSRGGAMSGPRGTVPCPYGAHYLPLPRAEQRAVAAFLLDAGIATGTDSTGRLQVPDELLVRDPAERVAALGFFEEGLWVQAGASAEDERELAAFEEKVESLVHRDERGRRLFALPIADSSQDLRSLDGISAAEWIEREGLRSERLRWYLEYATRDDFGAQLGDTSAWAMLHYFCARADLETKESAPYLTWPEGNARLVAELRRLTSDVAVHTNEVCRVVREEGSRGHVVSVNLDTGEGTNWIADHVVLATPQFVTQRLLLDDPAAASRAKARYGPWVVANLHLERRPANRGFPWAWDSVLFDSPSLGYVDACHQVDRADAHDTVWTWYLPITDSDERAARHALLARDWASWRDAILADLRVAHPDIDEVVTRIDLWRWGHGMIKPIPGWIWGEDRARAARPFGPIRFAHSDLSGVALFEEAHWQGTLAAEEILRAEGRLDEALA